MATENKKQLQMIWPKERGHTPPTWQVPAGFHLRTYQIGDEAGYIELMHSAGFSTWSADNFKTVMQTNLPDGLFFVVHDQIAKLVVTAVATHCPSELHPFGGQLGWVAVNPAFQGQGLGYIVSAAVTRRFLEAGYREIFLLTDDFRLPAIKTYLKLGWVPLLFLPDMEGRWLAVFEQLKMRPVWKVN